MHLHRRMKKKLEIISWETWKICAPDSRGTLQSHLSCMSQAEVNVHLLLLPFSPPSNILVNLDGIQLLFWKEAIKSSGTGCSKKDTYSANSNFRQRICSQADARKKYLTGLMEEFSTLNFSLNYCNVLVFLLLRIGIE